MATKLGVIIGRFQPITDFHVDQIFKPAIKNSDHVLVLLGSVDRARSPREPFEADLTKEMIRSAVKSIDLANFKINFDTVRDYWYSETKWLSDIQQKVSKLENHLGEDLDITLYGVEGGNYDFLDKFPQWSVSISKAKAPEFDLLGNLFEYQDEWMRYVSPQIYSRIKTWIASDNGRKMIEEYHYLEKYKAATQIGKYPIVFQTVDNVVIYKGNILLVQRKAKPGKGLWAMPGGFLGSSETLFESAVRELKEETHLNVKPEWLVSQETFDAPQRSLRGRTITRAFLWKIPDWRNVPQVKADSDAAKAKWFPIAKVRDMANQMFEDHLDIIEEMLERL